MESVDKYLGSAILTSLGNTDKQGVFMEFSAADFYDVVDGEFNNFMATLKDIKEDIVLNDLKVSLKILPLKPENVTESKTHSVKIQFKFKQK